MQFKAVFIGGKGRKFEKKQVEVKNIRGSSEFMIFLYKKCALSSHGETKGLPGYCLFVRYCEIQPGVSQCSPTRSGGLYVDRGRYFTVPMKTNRQCPVCCMVRLGNHLYTVNKVLDNKYYYKTSTIFTFFSQYLTCI